MRLLLVGLAFPLIPAPCLGTTVNAPGSLMKGALYLDPILIRSDQELKPFSDEVFWAESELVPSAAVVGKTPSSAATPFFDGGGWILPTPIAYTSRNERTPAIAVDATGNMWATVLVEDEQAHIEVFRSTDRGISWTYVFEIHNSYGGSLGAPALFVDPGPTPNIVYLAFTSFWKDEKGSGHTGFEVASFASDRPAETFQSVWVSRPADFDISELGLSVERGRGPNNMAFVPARAVNRLTGVQYIWVFRGSRYASWSKVLSLGGNRCYAGGPEVWSTDRATYIIYKANAANSLPDDAKRVHILTTLDRGQSWKGVYADAPYPVAEVSVAGALGGEEAVAFASLIYGRSDHDVYAFYTTNLGMSWGGYWMETDNQDTRLPMVSPDGVQFDAGASAVFYFVEYCDRQNDGIGNIKFLMCPADKVAERSNWHLPDGSSLDSLVISDELSYGVEPDKGCLRLASRSEFGGTMPVVVWNTPYISLTGDVYFARPVAPVYMATQEDGAARGLRVLFIPSEHALRIEGGLPEGSQLRLYSVDGRLAASFELSPKGKTTTVDLPHLPEGVYLWRLLQTGGRVTILR